jgi:cell division protein ZapA
VIGNRGYPLVVERKDEEKYRHAAKILNDMVLLFKSQYADKDSQDILAMAAFQFALKYLNEKKEEKYDLLLDEIRNVNEDVTGFLNRKTRV